MKDTSEKLSRSKQLSSGVKKKNQLFKQKDANRKVTENRVAGLNDRSRDRLPV